MDLNETGCESVERVQLDPLNMMMNLEVQLKEGIY